MQKESIKLIIYKHFFKCCHIKFQYQFHHLYRPHMDLFSITIIEFHFNLTLSSGRLIKCTPIKD